MKMIKAIIRPEKSDAILTKLSSEGFRAVTKFGILGRGKQGGLKVNEVYYDELPKEMLMLVVPDESVEGVVNIIIQESKADHDGNFGDGKIFILPVDKVVTVSSGKYEL